MSGKIKGERFVREITVEAITEAVAQMCISSNLELSPDIRNALAKAAEREKSPVAQDILEKLLKNADIARDEQIPICQDTGMAVIFAELGQEVIISGGLLKDAINEGVRRGYEKGFLRKSVVSDPLRRVNTGDNTPAAIHFDIVEGDRLKLTVAPKGFGSENMSAVGLLKPSDGREGVVEFVLKTVKNAGSNPCPPIVVGVGIGGTLSKAALLSKLALTRDVNISNADEYYKDLEEELLEKINALGIGASGLGGSTTALGVNVEAFATHIAGLPVSVNISCHVTRHQVRVL